MITEIRMKRDKIATGLTFSGPSDVISSWAKAMPRVIVYGETEPPKLDGVRFVATNSVPIVKNLLGTYLYMIPGNEVLMIGNPDVVVGGDKATMLEYVTRQKMELAWACRCDIGGAPRAFIMSAGVVGHLMRDIPEKMTARDPWLKWIGEWMVKMLPPHRYFDGTEYGIVSEVVNPVLNAYSVAPEAVPELVEVVAPVSLAMPVKRRGRPKKK